MFALQLGSLQSAPSRSAIAKGAAGEHERIADFARLECR